MSRLRDEDKCKDRDKHTPNQPEGYIQWFSWARKMGKTHRCTKCPTCDLYVIWVPKRKWKKIDPSLSKSLS